MTYFLYSNFFFFFWNNLFQKLLNFWKVQHNFWLPGFIGGSGNLILSHLLTFQNPSTWSLSLDFKIQNLVEEKSPVSLSRGSAPRVKFWLNYKSEETNLNFCVVRFQLQYIFKNHLIKNNDSEISSAHKEILGKRKEEVWIFTTLDSLILFYVYYLEQLKLSVRAIFASFIKVVRL